MNFRLFPILRLVRRHILDDARRRSDAMQKIGDVLVSCVHCHCFWEQACLVATVDDRVVVDEIGQNAARSLLCCEMDARVAHLMITGEMWPTESSRLMLMEV